MGVMDVQNVNIACHIICFFVYKWRWWKPKWAFGFVEIDEGEEKKIIFFEGQKSCVKKHIRIGQCPMPIDFRTQKVAISHYINFTNDQFSLLSIFK